MRTIVYIDSFNLYYGCLRKSPYKWLDLGALSHRLLPDHDIQRIRFYSAKVKSRPTDPNQAQRQQIYFRALETIPDFCFHFGKFSTEPRYMAPADQPPGSPLVRVWTTQEKGSDVNLATHLLTDGFQSRYELAAIISGDTDLLAPIRAVREVLGLQTCVINPSRYSKQLQQVAHAYLTIAEDDLAACQFPAEMTDKKGRRFTKPASW